MATMTSSEPDNTIEREINWLASVIELRMKSHFSADADEQTDIFPPPPQTPQRSFYSEIITENRLAFNERLILALATAPYVKPETLDVFFLKNSVDDRVFTEFGGVRGKNHAGFIPTAQTALFLIAGSNIAKRAAAMELFTDSPLFTDQILRLLPVEPGEPTMSGILTLSDDQQHALVTGKQEKPDFNINFPAKLITTPLNWEDLVIDNHVLDELEEIRTWLAAGEELMQKDGISKKIKPGFRSLLYGPPGTGKTLTASLLGKSSGRDVYRVDLSMIVSKYIGETEKNLSNVFNKAEKKKWILFFDEADALFGKRTQTSNSNDRYANQEVSYLLQRIEDFPGVIILATNFRSNIDEAFARRFQSIIHFAMPGPAERLLLWKKIFDTKDFQLAPSVNLNELAAKYQVAGGALINIFRSCVLRAIRFRQSAITLQDILHGLKKELHKEGKTL